MSQIYDEYTKARLGWVLGLTGWQASVVATATLPVFWALHQQAWAAAGLFTLTAGVVAVVTVVPVRGRSALGWAGATVAFSAGRARGWTRFRSAAACGQVGDLATVDLPGVLAGITVHEGPPNGLAGERTAIIQNHAMRTWAVTAALVHPGTGLRDAPERARMGRGLSDLLDQAARTQLIDEVLFLVRTVPEDGAERDQWTTRHRVEDGHPGVRAINEDLQQVLTRASVRTEAFLTLLVPEGRIAKPAREAGGGLDGRALVLYGLMSEVDTQLRIGLGATSVAWLTSPQLAVAVRTGFAPGDRAGIIDALSAHGHDDTVNTGVPWALAGPSGAEPSARHYSHDAWNSVSATLTLPVKGALLGALAPVLTPSAAPGERRSILVAFPILTHTKATRTSAGSEWATDMGEALRARAGMKQSTKAKDEAQQVRGIEAKISRGQAMTHPYAVCTVTAPKTTRISAAGRDLDASIRRAGFAPLRLDLSQDAAFAASALPLGVSLTRRSDA